MLTAILYGICAIFVIQNQELYALIFFTLGIFIYLLSFTFYTPLLNAIASPEKRGLVSGIGVAANYLGQITGLIIALPFSTGAISLFHSSPRAETLLPAVGVFLALSLPMLLFFTEPKWSSGENIRWARELRAVSSETKKLFLVPSVGLFITAYFLFNDAILTAANNFPIFLEQVWHVSDTIKTYILLGILVTSAIGGGLSGWLADWYGHKRTLKLVLIGWVFILPIVGWTSNFILFVIATAFMGFWFGANWAVSRSVMSYIAPVGQHNLAFAYFGLAERASSLVGPLIWGGIVSSLVSIGSDRYRYAALAITLFIIFGLIALSKIRDDKEGI